MSVLKNAKNGRTLPPVRDGDINDCETRVCARLRAFWGDLSSRVGGIPRTTEFELMDIYDIADRVVLKDVVDGGRDFRNRFWGTYLVQSFDIEWTRLLVSDYQPVGLRDLVLQMNRAVLEKRAPICHRARIKHLESRDFLSYEVLHVPFRAAEGEEIAQILSAYDFDVVVAESAGG
ncbi:MAG: hypothetical protein JJ900_18625 [Rhodospirillales bacterium]|nr:hypothetical protein [Rhodospirillales bacterium]MBO6788868.1 hypothetical protein [Rhodospirillales bacterium]